MANFMVKFLIVLFLAGSLLLFGCTAGAEDEDDQGDHDAPLTEQEVMQMRQRNTDPPPVNPDGTRG